MRKFFIIISLFFAVPVFSACPVDEATSSCSLADAVKFPSPNIDSGFDTNVGNKSSGALRVPDVNRSRLSKEYTSTSDNKPESNERNYKDQTPLRNYRQDKSDFSYNASCQFGFCNQTGTPQLFQQRNE